MVRLSLLVAGAAAPLLLAVSLSSAHDAPTGWSYPAKCCSAVDCRPVTTKQISERPEGYVIQSSGEVVAYQDTRIKDSPDGDYHWCSLQGADTSRTICLFVPPRAF